MRPNPLKSLGVALAAAAAVLAQDPESVGGPYFANGIKIGEVRSTSAVVWTRLTRAPLASAGGLPFERVPRDREQLPPDTDLAAMQGAVPGMAGEVRIAYEVAGEPDTKRHTDWQAVTESTDHAHVFHLEDLAAGADYRLIAEARPPRGEVSSRVEGRFGTAPLPTATAAVSFCVVTGQDYHRRDDPERGHRIYGHMLALDPDFLVHTGDTVYYDRPQPFATSVELARFKWNRIYGMPEQREFHRRIPCYFLKDDHDTLKDDCWPGQRYGELTWAQGLAIYREQLPVLEPPYRRVRWGRDLEIWLVEGREYRSPNTMADGPDKTVWGAQQKRWVMETMRASDATWRVLISPTPIVGPDRSNKNDNHSNAGFAREGAELRAFLASLPNTIVICGDRHWQYVSRDPVTGLREWSCGPTTDAHAGGFSAKDRSEMHEYLAVRGGFLRAEVRPSERGARLVMRHFGADGAMLHEVVLGED